jgi:plasmid stabilization system protein ParE
LTPLPYFLVYRVTAGVVEVLRVLHTARRWPAKKARPTRG